MKRLFLFFSIVALMTSCTMVNTDSTDVVNLTVRAQDWLVNYDQANDIPQYYSYTFSMPEITPLMYEEGLVQVYGVFDGAQQVLPYVQHFQGTDNVNTWRWTRTIDYRYAAGELTVFVTNSDFANDPPKGMNFRVVLIK